MAEQIDIIIPFFNHAMLTIGCIEAVKKNSSDFRLILVDDGSALEESNAIKAYLESNSQVFLFERPSETNRGFVKAANHGMRLSTSAEIVLLNNDVEVTSGWLTKLREYARRNKPSGVIGVLTDTGKIQNFRKYWGEPRDAFKMINSRMYLVRNIIHSCVPFSCVLIKRAVISKIGYLDEDFSPCLGEDDDFCDRARLAGFKTVILLNVAVYHRHRTTVNEVPNIEAIKERNRELYFKKMAQRRKK